MGHGQDYITHFEFSRWSSVIVRLALDIFDLIAKFVDFCFSHYGDMIASVKIQNGLCNPE